MLLIQLCSNCFCYFVATLRCEAHDVFFGVLKYVRNFILAAFFCFVACFAIPEPQIISESGRNVGGVLAVVDVSSDIVNSFVRDLRERECNWRLSLDKKWRQNFLQRHSAK